MRRIYACDIVKLIFSAESLAVCALMLIWVNWKLLWMRRFTVLSKPEEETQFGFHVNFMALDSNGEDFI